MLYVAASIIALIVLLVVFYNDFSLMVTKILPGFNPIIIAGILFVFASGFVYAMTR